MSLKLERKLFPTLWASALAGVLVLAGCDAPWSTPDPLSVYAKVPLKQLNSAPQDYLQRKVCFDAAFAGRTPLYVPFSTQFTRDEYVNFSVWPADARLWLAPEMEAPFMHLFVPRDEGGLVEENPEKPLTKLDGLSRYQLVTVYGKVVSDRDNSAWVVVDSVRPRDGRSFTPESIRRLKLATERMAGRQTAAAARDFAAAVSLGLPAEATPFVHRDLGMCLAAEGDYAGAIQNLSVAESAGVVDAEALVILAEARMETGEILGAERTARAALAADPKSIPARALLALALGRLGKVSAAMDEISDALKLCPADAPDASLLRVRGIVLDLSGPTKLDDAIDSYRQAVRARPTDPRIQRELGALLLKKGDLPAAKDVLENVLTLGKESTAGYCQVCCQLADISVKLNKGEDAGRYYLLAQKRDPAYIPAYMGLGALLVAGGRGDDALGQYKTVAEKLDPQGENGQLAWRRCAEIYRAKANPEASAKAAECLEKALAIRPRDYSGWMELATLRWEQPQPDRAAVAAALHRAIEADSRQSQAPFLLGKVLLEQIKVKGDAGMVRAAAAAFESARNLDPANVQTRLLLGQTYRRLCRDAEAKTEFEAVLAKDAASLDAKNSLAFVLADLGGPENLARAEKLAGEVVAAKPGEVAYQDTLGWVQARAGKFADAENTLAKAANASSEAAILYHLGFAQAGGGKLDKAIETLGKAQRSQRQGPKVCPSCDKLEKDIAELLDRVTKEKNAPKPEAGDKTKKEDDSKKKAEPGKDKPPAPAPAPAPAK